MNEVIRTRFLTAGGSMLAATGLAAAMVVGPAAAEDRPNDSDGTTATAAVEEVISVDAEGAGVALATTPGVTANVSRTLKVKSNSMSGYHVTVEADSDVFSSADGDNGDSIAVNKLKIGDTPVPADTENAPAQIYTTDGRTESGGFDVPLAYELEMPWVNADTYSVGLTYTATSNG